MRFPLRCLALGTLLAASPALADPTYHIGNTLLIKRTTGTGKMMYRADHTFTLLAIGGDKVNGTWRAVAGKLCLTPIKSKMQPFCVADDPVHKVGDVWNVKSPDGIDEQLTLVKGQQ